MKKIKIIDNLIVIILSFYVSGFMNFASVVYLKQGSYLLGATITALALLLFFTRNFGTLKVCFDSKLFIFSLSVVGIYPLFTFAYSPFPDPKEFLRQIFHVGLMSYFVCILVNNNREMLGRFFLISLFITIIGGLLSVHLPTYFNEFVLNRITRKEGAFADFEGEFYQNSGRAFGFQFQPNSYALLVSVLLLGYLYFYDTRNTVLKIIVLLISVYAVVISGSRSGFLGLFVVGFLYVIHLPKVGVRLKNGKIASGVTAFFMLITVSIISVLVFIAFKSVIFPDEQFLTSLGATTPLERIKGLFSSEITGDGSLSSRTEAQLFFIRKAFSSGLGLIAGNGFGSTALLILSGEIEIFSHSFWVNSLYEFGLIYIISMITLILILLAKRRVAKTQYDKNAIFDSIMLFFIITQSGILFLNPILPTILGIIIGLSVSTELNQHRIGPINWMYRSERL